MCGIYGMTKEDRTLLTEMSRESVFRGPDYDGGYVGQGVSLAFNHLVIDQLPINAIRQPYTTPEGNILTWNGEIYDTYEPDTKWLARNFDLHGPQFLRSHAGMWAYAYFNTRARTITLGRDHFGTKPLFYTIVNDVLYYASSILSLAGIPGVNLDIDDFAVKLHADFGGYVPGPKTMYKGIQKIIPGEIKVWSVDEKRFTSTSSYYDFKLTTMRVSDFDPDYYRSKVRFCLQQGALTKYPAGLFLSGGLDSSLILSSLSNLTTLNLTSFICKFDNRNVDDSVEHYPLLYRESDLAIRTASYHKSPYDVMVMNYHEYSKSNNDGIVKMMGHPLQEKARWYPRQRLAKRAASMGTKVIYTGDFGDELFGYVTSMNKFFEGLYVHNKGSIEHAQEVSEYVNSWFPLNALGNDSNNNAALLQCLTVGEMYNALSDAVCSYYSMESRPLFCHQDLAFFLLTIPGAVKMRSQRRGQGITAGAFKGLIRDLFADQIHPEVRRDMHKVGWSVPWDAKDKYAAFMRAMEELDESEEVLYHKTFKTDT